MRPVPAPVTAISSLLPASGPGPSGREKTSATRTALGVYLPRSWTAKMEIPVQHVRPGGEHSDDSRHGLGFAASAHAGDGRADHPARAVPAGLLFARDG